MLRHTFRALGHAGYRCYFIGQGISQIGNWTQQIVLSWLTYAQSGSAWTLALVVALGQLPLLLLGPYAGVLADRHPRRPLLLACQVLGLLLASGLALSSLSAEPGVGLLLAASSGTGLLNALEMPVRQALLGALIGNRDLRDNALALNSLSFNAARLIGPPLAGLLFTHYGAALCFALNALSYLAALYSLRRMPVMPAPVNPHARAGLDQALRWLRDTHPARWLLLAAGISSLCLAPFMALLPVYARDIFALDPAGLGQLLGASGLGALLATLLLASRRNQWRLETFMAGGALLFGLSCLGFACNRHLWLAWPLMVAAGAGLVACVTSSGILLQSLVTDALRGRVMALHGMAYVGSMPLGSLLAGGLAAQLSVPAAFAIAGLGMLILSALLLRWLPKPSICPAQPTSEPLSLK
ncbi:MAG TPA: MFS transporter [Burkholderiaceae bacterium]